jgi:hypothetical protein
MLWHDTATTTLRRQAVKQLSPVRRISLACVALLLAVLVSERPASADASKYPQFAQQPLPANVTPSFISVDELVQEIRAGKKPLIVDVRSAEEFLGVRDDLIAEGYRRVQVAGEVKDLDQVRLVRISP